MQHMLVVSFFLRKTRIDKKNQAPIIVRLKHRNICRDMSSGLRINPEKWNSKTCRVQGRGDEVKQINQLLETIRTRLFEIYTNMSRDEDFTLDDVIDEYSGNAQQKEQLLLKLVTEHNQSIHRRIGIDYTRSTYQKYWAMEIRLTQYVKEHLGKRDIALRKLDRKFIGDFFLYLKEVHKNQHNSATKTTKNLKRVLSYAVEQGYISSNPFVGFQCGYRETLRTVLTVEELRLIETRTFTTPRLELVRNLFLFQCYTGLSYVDMAQLKWRNIVAGDADVFWLEITRKKTAETTQIPLFPIALQIIKKYSKGSNHGPDEKLLPVYEIQKTNAYLKEIADICGINKALTTHAGRRTFASTVMLNNGVRIEAVSRMLAHKSLRMTQQYAKVYDQHLLDQTRHIRWLWNGEEKGNQENL
ncbi:MAG: site-specific integrase [Sphingobacteriales bacterium]|nr:MAG: site-specific integrase [Sphingobacteriales bacterium]